MLRVAAVLFRKIQLFRVKRNAGFCGTSQVELLEGVEQVLRLSAVDVDSDNFT